MVSEKEVKHIAQLARLGLPKSEEKKIREKLSSILQYVAQLNELDLAEEKPASRSVKIENAMRKDEAKESDPETRNKLIESAPEKESGFIKVKSVLY